jgi:hypothetical protein
VRKKGDKIIKKSIMVYMSKKFLELDNPWKGVAVGVLFCTLVVVWGRSRGVWEAVNWILDPNWWEKKLVAEVYTQHRKTIAAFVEIFKAGSRWALLMPQVEAVSQEIPEFARYYFAHESTFTYAKLLWGGISVYDERTKKYLYFLKEVKFEDNKIWWELIPIGIENPTNQKYYLTQKQVPLLK